MAAIAVTKDVTPATNAHKAYQTFQRVERTTAWRIDALQKPAMTQLATGGVTITSEAENAEVDVKHPSTPRLAISS
ncbi:hypothetical protein N7468_008517 [Penicillium chermesinum]|uniref:Uncharacterized protein n=1 Tax=Penicillium chermesinum TaxID=63820 RepID=A0A9W9NPV8_9EURO|nr:uncharacterized protein N7468_008517 [Penicillium chermesinum]KAJ5223975.1 hypothetical protein N7468_008517 [Penicillium chermesinum]KAJ6155204.1 hypothetical protein N7470_005770 [Penicillium chermesinum]